MPVLVYASGVGSTAVMYAAENGHEPCVRALVEGKADLNLQGKYGKTALDRAVIANGSDDGKAAVLSSNCWSPREWE